MTLKKSSSGPNLIAKTTIYTICCFKNVGGLILSTIYNFISVSVCIDMGLSALL
jgi:hypothetical protein